MSPDVMPLYNSDGVTNMQALLRSIGMNEHKVNDFMYLFGKYSGVSDDIDNVCENVPVFSFEKNQMLQWIESDAEAGDLKLFGFSVGNITEVRILRKQLQVVDVNNRHMNSLNDRQRAEFDDWGYTMMDR